jgi:hypothetical protein
MLQKGFSTCLMRVSFKLDTLIFLRLEAVDIQAGTTTFDGNNCVLCGKKEPINITQNRQESRTRT